jgi:hypothetical protein
VHAPYNTTVEGVFQAGKLERPVVTPERCRQSRALVGEADGTFHFRKGRELGPKTILAAMPQARKRRMRAQNRVQVGFTMLALTVLMSLPARGADDPPDLTKAETRGVDGQLL